LRAVLKWLAIALGVVAVAIYLMGGVVAAPVGLKASYWAMASPSGPPERSTDFPSLAGEATRIEPTLDLRGEDFGVHFFNDATRFNFGADVQPGRDQLAFSVRWDGWLLAPSDGPRRFVLHSQGPAQVWLDDAPLSGGDVTQQVSAGLHVLRVEYARPEAKVPELQLEWQREPGGALEPIGGADVRWRADATSPAFGEALRLLAAMLGAVALALGAWLAWRQLARRGGLDRVWWIGLCLLPLVFGVYGALLEAPMAGKATILSGLDDWLIYESSARDILLNGVLMDCGQGHAAPFYGQPLYPYVLALLHRLTGESLFGPIVVQFAALGLVVAGTGVLARRAFGARFDGLAAIAGLLVLLQLEPEHFKIARQLFNENLYMPLVMACLVVLVVLARLRGMPTWWQAFLAGVLLGVTAISRSQFLLCVPFALLVLWLAWRRAPDAARARSGLRALVLVGVVAVGLVIAVAPVTLRNWVVSGQLVPISSSGGASLLEFHRPPAGLIDQSALDKDTLFNALHLDQSTRTVVAFVEKDPGGYVATLLPLGAHSIGLNGRNDPGIYWPLFVTFLLYLASFSLRATRRLHVWPIHAFIATHLLILMLFEADTYGYRLVMPMYAPMVAVAAQLPLEALRWALRSRAANSVRSGDPVRSARFAVVGWGTLAVAALVWQAGTLVQAWPEREPALHGLGGAAAHAALTSDRLTANAIYVASVDGTPRRFGAGSLTGLRYPWFKWFDPQRTLPLPPPSTTAVYMLSELRGQPDRTGDLTACLGSPDPSGEVVMDSDHVRQACVAQLTPAGQSSGPTFDGLARIDAVDVPSSVAAGESLDARLLWEPLANHPEPQQISLQLDDPSAGDGTLWGNGTLELYPASEWQTDEALFSRIPVATDATAIPQQYRLTVGMNGTKPNAPPAMASWQGARTDRVPVATVTLTPGSGDASGALPADMRPIEGPALRGGGLELIAARPLPEQAAVGGPLRVGLLWKAVQDQPSATQVHIRLVGGDGGVLQDVALPLFGGRTSPGALHLGNVVRDEQSFVVDARVPNGQASVEVGLEDAWLRVGSVELTGRAHALDSSGAAALATFGGTMDLLSASVDPGTAHAGDKVTVHLRWRAAAAMNVAYKIFVHVLDASGQQVLAQRDAEPQDGAAPTTSWMVGEALDDSYVLQLPASVGPGEYPIEIGVYEPRSGDRLTLATGDNHAILDQRLLIR
jgi:hypothetical protein